MQALIELPDAGSQASSRVGRIVPTMPECTNGLNFSQVFLFIDNHSHCDLVSQPFLILSPVMYVCLCNGITESQIRDAVGGGARSLSELHRCLGVASCCGRCADCAQQVLHETLSSGQLSREQLKAA